MSPDDERAAIEALKALAEVHDHIRRSPAAHAKLVDEDRFSFGHCADCEMPIWSGAAHDCPGPGVPMAGPHPNARYEPTDADVCRRRWDPPVDEDGNDGR